MNVSTDPSYDDSMSIGKDFSSLSVQSHEFEVRSLDNLNNAKLTPVNSHPLMFQLSPTGSNDSSDIEYAAPGSFQTFPDLVPEKEKPHSTSRPILENRSFSSARNQNENANYSNSKNASNTNKASKSTLSTLDVVSNSEKCKGVRKKIAVLEEPGISSGSEQDLSQYQATVGPTYESVTLVANSVIIGNKIKKKPETLCMQKRKIALDSDLFSDDLSSPETLSGQSMEGFRGRKMSLSPSSSIFDDTGFIDESPSKKDLEQQPTTETRDRSNWVKVTLPDGKTREIDMKVIEPYKRILSHGGYMNNKKNAVIVFSSCFLPDRSRSDYHYVMANLFLYVIKTLEQLITDDYVLIYFHGGSNKNNVPPFRWLKK